MHPKISSLVELQSIDLQLADVQKKLAEFPRRLAEQEARLETARQQVAAAKNSLTQSLKDRKTFEMDVDSWKEKVRKYKDQSGQVKSNDAYKALLHEIENAEKEVAKAEDRLLDRMVAGEEFERRVKDAEAAVKVLEGEVAAERSKIQAEKAAEDARAADLSAKRAAALANVPEDLQTLYQQVARRHHGVAMAAERNDACGACGFMVRPHVTQEMARGSEEVFRCEGCGRILYVADAPQAAASGK